MRKCISLKSERKGKKNFAFKVMKKATEGLMIVTVSVVLSTGFTKNIYGDEKMGQKTEEKKVEAPIPTKIETPSRERSLSQFSDDLHAGFQNRGEVSLEKFKEVFEGQSYTDLISKNKEQLMKLGVREEKFNEIIEIAQNYDVNKVDSINFRDFIGHKNVTHGFLAYLSVVDENSVLNTQSLNIYLHQVSERFNRENYTLLGICDNIHTNSLAEHQQNKTLVGQFDTRAQFNPSMRGATPPLRDVEVIELAGALTGHVIGEHITRNTSGEYMISTDRENLRKAAEKLKNRLNSKEVEPTGEEYENLKRDLEKLNELLSRREKTFDLKVGGGTGVSFNYKALNIGLDYSLLRDITGDIKRIRVYDTENQEYKEIEEIKKEERHKFQVNLGYVGRLNMFTNGFIAGGYSYDETNLYKHTWSGQAGLSFYVGSPNHLLSTYVKYSHTFGMGKEGHEYGGGMRYDYKNLGIDVSVTNKSVGMKLTGDLPITNNVGLFGEVGLNYYLNLLIEGGAKAGVKEGGAKAGAKEGRAKAGVKEGRAKVGVKYSTGNWELRFYVEGSVMHRKEGGL